MQGERVERPRPRGREPITQRTVPPHSVLVLPTLFAEDSSYLAWVQEALPEQPIEWAMSPEYPWQLPVIEQRSSLDGGATRGADHQSDDGPRRAVLLTTSVMGGGWCPYGVYRASKCLEINLPSSNCPDETASDIQRSTGTVRHIGKFIRDAMTNTLACHGLVVPISRWRTPAHQRRNTRMTARVAVLPPAA